MTIAETIKILRNIGCQQCFVIIATTVLASKQHEVPIQKGSGICFYQILPLGSVCTGTRFLNQLMANPRVSETKSQLRGKLVTAVRANPR